MAVFSDCGSNIFAGQRLGNDFAHAGLQTQRLGKMTDPTTQQVSEYLSTGLLAVGVKATKLIVNGDGRHFEAIIVSAAFEGKTLMQRHRLVYAALGERMREEIHALSMQTLTPEQWRSHKINQPEPPLK